MSNKLRNKPILIAGPCAAESHSQILTSIKEAKKRDVDFMRISLWKPRTKPGFEGLNEEGIDLMVEAAKHGINPATEVIMPEHAEKVVEKVLAATSDGKVLIWIGARNQNHFIQQKIAKIAAQDKRIFLLVKNQPWSSEKHWQGIVEHILTGGIDRENVILCHRGFVPHGYDNPRNMRNVPDFEMAIKVQMEYDLPMVFDPSHIGGSVENVLYIANIAARQDFDGLMVEVHPDPKNALTDAKQQITWKQFDGMVKEWNNTESVTSFANMSV